MSGDLETSGSENVVGHGVYFIDFSRARIAGVSGRGLSVSASLFISFGIIALYGFISTLDPRPLIIALVSLSMGLLLVWTHLSSLRILGELRNAGFKIEYVVKSAGKGYSLDINISAVTLRRSSRIRLIFSTGYSYALIKHDLLGRTPRTLSGGRVFEKKTVLEDTAVEGYNRWVSISPRELICTSFIGGDGFRFVSGSFIVLEADFGERTKGYAVIPIIFSPIADTMGEKGIGKKSVSGKIRVGERDVVIDASIARYMKNISSIEAGITYHINIVFDEKNIYRKEINIPLAKTKPLDKRVTIRIDFENALPKIMRKTRAKSMKPPEPLIVLGSPRTSIVSYAYIARGNNLRLPPLYKSYMHRESGVRITYYLKLKKKRGKDETIYVEAPLPPVITGTVSSQ